MKVCPQCSAEYESDQRFCPKDGTTLRLIKPADSLVGTIIADRYDVVRKLGEGGMGQVYLAEHVKIRRKNAVKVMNPRLVNDADAIARFNREAANSAQIAHPNVASVYDFGETAEGLIFLAMEYIDGEPLTAVIKRQGALDARRAADIARQVAEGLAAAHELGIVHRDLKPDNIMIAKGRSGGDAVKIVDFGIAKAVQAGEQNVTRTGLAVGTPEYMSPEQLAGDKVDHRSDIYSLGLVAFNMLTGQLPFPNVTSKEALISRLTERPRTLSQIRGDVAWPPRIQEVMDRALSSDVEDRYDEVADFGRDLTQAIAEMPESALAEIGTQVIVTSGGMPALATSGPRTPVPGPAVPRRDSITEPIAKPSTGQSPAATAPAGQHQNRESVGVPAGGEDLFHTGRKRNIGLGVGAVALVAVALFAMNATRGSDSPTATPSAPTPQPVATDTTAAPPRTDTPAVQPAAPVTDTPRAAPPAAQKTAARPTPPREPDRVPTPSAPTLSAAEIASLLAPVKEDIATANQRADDGKYERADIMFGNAAAKLAALVKQHPRVAAFAAESREVARQRASLKSACSAEQRLATGRGETPPDCP